LPHTHVSLFCGQKNPFPCFVDDKPVVHHFCWYSADLSSVISTFASDNRQAKIKFKKRVLTSSRSEKGRFWTRRTVQGRALKAMVATTHDDFHYTLDFTSVNASSSTLDTADIGIRHRLTWGRRGLRWWGYLSALATASIGYSYTMQHEEGTVHLTLLKQR
jgi:hypothetical protein